MLPIHQDDLLMF